MTQKTCIKKIKIPVGKEIFLYSVENTNLLISTTSLDKKYVVIPHFISFSIDKENLTFSYTEDDQEKFNNFLFNLNFWLKNIVRLYRQTLFLKGLGFKASFSEEKNILLLKLGYSHISSVVIPTERILVKVNKNSIIVEGFDPVEVGNFAGGIRRLKFPDIYKGKGIWYKNEVKTLKELKKK